MNRRAFLKQALLFSASGIFLLRPHGWAASSTEEQGKRKRLIVIFLRGAVDGLSVVVPYGDPLYYDARPTIAIPRSGSDAGVLTLSGYFGLHPALAAVHPLWRDGTLAFVHACGSPDPSRSHFDAQDYMESGTPGIKSTPDGWMNRLLAVLPGSHGATEALSFGPTLPRILAGRMPVANVPFSRGAVHPIPLDRPRIEAAFARLYQGSDPLSQAYREGRAARKRFMAALETEMQAADNGAPPPRGFATEAAQLARLMVREPSIHLAFLALGGWDTHVNQGSSAGQLATHLRPLGEGLMSLVTSLGAVYSDTVILILSEFGRTVHENGNGGTDHGHGNVLWVVGGNIRGRKVYGRWPGLSAAALYQERDLAATTDFRSVMALLLQYRLNLTTEHIGTVFPNSPAPTNTLKGMVKF